MNTRQTHAADWWDDLLFADDSSPQHLRFEPMLRLIAYDISDPKRLRRVAKACEAFGARVQLSVFECWLDDDRLQALLTRIHGEIDSDHDRILVYSIDAKFAKKRQTLGKLSTKTDPPAQVAIF